MKCENKCGRNMNPRGVHFAGVVVVFFRKVIYNSCTRPKSPAPPHSWTHSATTEHCAAVLNLFGTQLTKPCFISSDKRPRAKSCERKVDRKKESEVIGEQQNEHKANNAQVLERAESPVWTGSEQKKKKKV